MRRREQERLKLERIRQEVHEQKEDNFKRKIDYHLEIENQSSVKKAMKFERKHMTAEQLR